MKPPNLFESLPESLAEERFDVLMEDPRVRIERILSAGHASPPGFWYDQPRDEWILLLRGFARLTLETDHALRTVELRPGDHLHLPARCRHRVEETSGNEKTVWLAIHWNP